MFGKRVYIESFQEIASDMDNYFSFSKQKTNHLKTENFKSNCETNQNEASQI